jgi:hypothetical protein
MEPLIKNSQGAKQVALLELALATIAPYGNLAKVFQFHVRILVHVCVHFHVRFRVHFRIRFLSVSVSMSISVPMSIKYGATNIFV